MKPSVARRCKDQVREDGGRGWQREREERRVCLVHAHAYVHVYVHVDAFLWACVCVFVYARVCVCVCVDGGQRERWNTVKQKQNSGSETGAEKKRQEALIH